MFITDDALQEISGVAATGLATIKLPVGYSYHDVTLHMGGTSFTTAHISNIVLWINGREVMTWRTAAELDSENQFDRLTAYGGTLLRIPFELPGLDLREARERGIIGTGISEEQRRQLQDPKSFLYDPVQVRSMHITLQITGATGPTLTATARRSAPRPTNVLRHIRNFYRSIAGAGDYEISDFPVDDPIYRIGFKDAGGAGDITRVQLKVNGQTVFDRTAAKNSRIQTDGVRTPQAGYFWFDPSEDGALTNSPPLTGASDVRWIISTDGAVTLEAQYETLGFLRG